MFAVGVCQTLQQGLQTMVQKQACRMLSRQTSGCLAVGRRASFQRATC